MTGANRHDSTQLLPLVNNVPRIKGKRGAPRYRFDKLVGDRGYDCEADREALREVNITPYLARRNTEHGSGLGQWRWVVERTISWLHQFRRLRIRDEFRADIHEAFMILGCIMICYRKLESSFC